MRLTALFPPPPTPTTLILALSRVEKEQHLTDARRRRGDAETHVLVVGLRETQFLRAKEEEEEEEEENGLWRIEVGLVRGSMAIVTVVRVFVLGLTVKNWSLGF